MKKYLHSVMGLFATRGAAESANEILLGRGLQPAQLNMLQLGADGPVQEVRTASTELIYEALCQGALGAVIGLLAGVVAALVVVTATTGFFGPDPWLGARMWIGYGVLVGSLVGVIAGARRRRHAIADLLQMSLAEGYIVLVASTASETQTTMVELVLGQSMRVPFGVVASI